MHLPAKTLDDLIRGSLTSIRDEGRPIDPSKGGAREITGVLLELENPLARLSVTETKGTPFSCLGELCWYLSGRNDLASIEYYLRRYAKSADDGVLHGAYGPRLLNWRGVGQLRNVVTCLRRKDSRQAVVQLFDATDIQEPRKSDVPCTCTLQFLNRAGRLSLLASLRSNDVFWGLPHDVFCFTMLQEIVANELGLSLGTYKQFVGSLHLYDDKAEDAERYLAEGWQATTSPMPPMPAGDPWPHVQSLLQFEESIRTRQELPGETLPAYWNDLVVLLRIYAALKVKDSTGAATLMDDLTGAVYRPLVAKRLATA